MDAQYILRFDDICPTMNWAVWEQVESILNSKGIKPIVAVVPDNRDPELIVDQAKIDFWERVRTWQDSGWTIALHGYQHIYCTKLSGLTKLNNYSEFVGLSFEEQLDKLQRGLRIFHDHGIYPKVWVAPAHSFDELTIQALLQLGIDTISDGYFYRPVKRLGVLWIPQQLWRFRRMRSGIWTVCFHINEFLTQIDVENFINGVEQFLPDITTLPRVLQEYKASNYNLIDKTMEMGWRMFLHLKRL